MKNTHTQQRTIQIIEEVEGANPFDCPFIGQACIQDDESALVYQMDEYTDPQDKLQKTLTILGMWRMSHGKRVQAWRISQDSDRFFPIERDTEASRVIMNHVISESLQELGLIKETDKVVQTSHDHPLVGVVCFYQGYIVLPFAFNIRESSEDEFSEGAEKTYSYLSLLFYRRKWDNPFEMEIGLGFEETGPRCRLAPIMRDTLHYRRAFNNLICALDKALDEKRNLKPVEVMPTELVEDSTAGV